MKSRENMHANNNIHLTSQSKLDHQFFNITKEKLTKLVENNPTQHFQHIISALKTNIDSGITGDQNDLHLRRASFGSNFISQPSSPQKTDLKRLIFDAFKDTTIPLLLCCATLSLIIGIKTNGLPQAIIDATLVLLAASFVLTFSTMFRFFKTKWMIKKSSGLKKPISVIRNGNLHKISESELVVGDLVCLQTGDRLPADGILINDDNPEKHDAIFSGTRVVKGCCRMIVTSVGENTERNRLIKSTSIDQKLHLLDAIDDHSSKLEKIWLSLSLILLLVQLVRCLKKPVQNDRDRNMDAKGVKNTMEDLMNESIKMMRKEGTKASGLVAVLCVLLFASRDGLPLAVFISLVYASKMMKSCEAVVQKLPESSTVGLVTTVCTGKTSDLVLEHTKMAELWIGCSRVCNLVDGEVDGGVVVDVLREGIFVHDLGDGCLEEISLIAWARAVLGDYNRDCSSSVVHEGHDKGRNVNCKIIKRGDDKVLHVNWKGAPDVILSMCSHYYTIAGKVETLDDNMKIAFFQIIHQHLVACSQRFFAFAYKPEIEQEEEEGVEINHVPNSLERDLIFVGFVGIKNPYSSDLIKAIGDCLKLGVRIKLMVEDDINTARIMAVNSGILNPEDEDAESGAIVEASDFRSISEEDQMKRVDNIQVLANASPLDKLQFVQCLRRKGETVAAIASTTRDSPLLQEAEIGLLTGDDDFKQDADILVVNKKFSQIPGIINLGRKVCKNIEKLIQLQLTLEISTFAVNIISLTVNSETTSLSAFQILWITLMVEILGAAAIAVTTIYHSESESESECSGGARGGQVYGSGAVVTRSMWRIVAVQSVFQLTFIMILEMKGKAIFRVNRSALRTMVFNCCVFFQVFSLVTAIDLDGNGVVSGLCTVKSCLFFGIVVGIGILQVVVVEVMGAVAHWSKLGVKEWCFCIGIASFSVPFNCAANWVSTR